MAAAGRWTAAMLLAALMLASVSSSMAWKKGRATFYGNEPWWVARDRAGTRKSPMRREATLAQRWNA